MRIIDRFNLEHYENWLRAAGYRPDTVGRALEVARRYLATCKDRDPADLDSVIAFLADAGSRVKRVSLLNYWKELQTLFRYAVSQRIVKKNPLDSIPRPRPTLHEKEKDTRFLPYSQKEYHQLTGATPFWTWVGLRDRAILALFWETPLRVSELLGLELSDIDWERRELRVRDGKGGAKYEALVSPDCLTALRVYLEDRPKQADRLFLGTRGEPLTRHAVEQLLQRLARRAGWQKPCSPHLFRHNWRLRMRALGLDDAAISACMGHSTVVISHSYARQGARTLAKDQLRQRLDGRRRGARGRVLRFPRRRAS